MKMDNNDKSIIKDVNANTDLTTDTKSELIEMIAEDTEIDDFVFGRCPPDKGGLGS